MNQKVKKTTKQVSDPDVVQNDPFPRPQQRREKQ
jgi:hypothetical protein